MRKKFIYILKSPLFSLTVFFVFFIYWFSYLITSDPLPSSDLPAQVTIIEQYKNYWYKGLFSFYDPTTFTGWPVHHFYGFLPFFITAPLSYVFELIAKDSVTLAINTVIVIMSSSLIYSLYFASKPFYEELFKSYNNLKLQQNRKSLDIYFVLMLGLLCFWFLNSDYHDSSLGIASPVLTGLYGQMFGWHAFLIYIGLLVRLTMNANKRYVVYLALSICLLFFCHTLTAVFAFAVGALSFLWFKKPRMQIFKAHILGMGLSGMWLLPFLHYMSGYTINSPVDPRDYLSVLFRYPIYNLFESVKSTIMGNYILINYSYVVIIFLVLTALVSKYVRKTRLLGTYLFFSVLLIALFSSGYILRSIPLGLHYYRFSGLLTLLIISLISVVYLEWFDKVSKRKNEYFQLAGLVFVLLISISFLFNAFIPNYYLDYIKNNKSLIKEQFADMEKVYDYFKQENSSGRVFIEYQNDYDKFPPINSHHYLSSFLYKNTGYEPVVGIQTPMSISYRQIAFTMRSFDPIIYITDYINRGVQLEIRGEDAIEQLKEFGITHIVAGSEIFTESIVDYGIEEPVEVNNYKIVKISETPYEKIKVSDKEILGFYDLKGNISFPLFDLYFSSTKYFVDNFELLQLKELNEIPEMIKIIIVNCNDEHYQNLQEKYSNYRIINLDYVDKSSDVRHYTPRRASINTEYYQYRFLASYLETSFDIQTEISEIHSKINVEDKTNTVKPFLSWSEDFQSFSLSNLVPGAIYRINYSFFPYWHSDDGQLYRGSGDRIFFVPEKSTAFVKYTRVYSPSTWIGWFLTAATAVFLIWYYRKQKWEYNK